MHSSVLTLGPHLHLIFFPKYEFKICSLIFEHMRAPREACTTWMGPCLDVPCWHGIFLSLILFFIFLLQLSQLPIIISHFSNSHMDTKSEFLHMRMGPTQAVPTLGFTPNVVWVPRLTFSWSIFFLPHLEFSLRGPQKFELPYIKIKNNQILNFNARKE